MASECGLSRIHERCTGSKQETQLIIGDVKSGSGWERFGGRFTGDAALLLTPREYEVDALGGTSYDDNTVWHVWIWPEPPQPEGEYVETEPIHLYDVPTSTVSTTSYSVSGNQDSGITASASALTTEDFDWVDDSGEIGGHAHIETSTTADPANGTITTTITASGLPPGVTVQTGTTVTNVPPAVPAGTVATVPARSSNTTANTLHCVCAMPNQKNAVEIETFLNVIRMIEAKNPDWTPQQVLDRALMLHKAKEDWWVYVYTTEQGWIDMPHFLEAASWTAAGHPPWLVNLGGILVEANQFQVGSTKPGFGSSAWSPEDLISNALGAEFGSTLDSSTPLSDQLACFLYAFDPLSPQDWRYFDLLPRTEVHWEDLWRSDPSLSSFLRFLFQHHMKPLPIAI